MTLKTDYRVFYAGKMSELVFLNLLAAFMWMEKAGVNNCLDHLVKLAMKKGQIFNFYNMKGPKLAWLRATMCSFFQGLF